jgi:hypothetical protein
MKPLRLDSLRAAKFKLCGPVPYPPMSSCQYPGFTEDGIPAIKFPDGAETTGFAYILYIDPFFVQLKKI